MDSTMKKVSKIILVIIGLLFGLMLTGCFNTQSNRTLYQENYDGNCFRDGITWSEMSFCLKNDRDKEWEQNELTNELAK